MDTVPVAGPGESDGASEPLAAAAADIEPEAVVADADTVLESGAEPEIGIVASAEHEPEAVVADADTTAALGAAPEAGIAEVDVPVVASYEEGPATVEPVSEAVAAESDGPLEEATDPEVAAGDSAMVASFEAEAGPVVADAESPTEGPLDTEPLEVDHSVPAQDAVTISLVTEIGPEEVASPAGGDAEAESRDWAEADAGEAPADWGVPETTAAQDPLSSAERVTVDWGAPVEEAATEAVTEEGVAAGWDTVDEPAVKASVEDGAAAAGWDTAEQAASPGSDDDLAASERVVITWEIEPHPAADFQIVRPSEDVTAVGVGAETEAATDLAAEADPRAVAIAERLEKLAARIRQRGAEALDDPDLFTDRLEAILATVLAGYFATKQDS